MTQTDTTAQLEVRVMTFNIRCDCESDGDDRWDMRKDFACDILREEAPDVVGLQEANRHQLDVFTESLPEYAEVGIGREGGREGEYSPILYKTARFDLNDSGTFWLSETPDKPSRDWESACYRICTWAKLTDKVSKQAFFVYNTHLDHKSQLARMKGIQLIKETIDNKSANAPALLIGDLNVKEDNPVIALLNEELIDVFRACHPNDKTVGTFHSFSGRADGPRIDYIFTKPGTKALDATIVRTSRDGHYPSDHFPVTAHLQFEYRRKLEQ